MRFQKKMVGALVVAVVGMVGMAPAWADPVNVSVGASTLGLGVQASIALIPGTLDLAVGINHLSKSRTGIYSSSNNSIPYSANLRLQTIPVLFDYFPFHGAFRLTGGAMINENQITAFSNGGSGGTYIIDGTSYPASQVGTFSGQVTYRRVAPYLGFGWGSKAAQDSGFSAGLDIGVLFTGSPNIQFSASNASPGSALASSVATAQANANAKASSYKLWPVIGFRLGYAF